MGSTTAESSPSALTELAVAAPAPPEVGEHAQRRIRARDVEVDLDAHIVRVADRAVVMTALELRLTAYLVANAGRVVPRAELADHGWGAQGAPKKALEVYMTRIRRRLGPDPSGRAYVRTVRTIGYIFDDR